MAVVSVKELHTRRRSTVQNGKLTHVRVFLVITDDIDDGTLVALTATDDTTAVPASGSKLNPGDFFSIVVTNKEAEPVNDSLFHFEVTCEYAAVDASKAPGDPLSRPPEISWQPTEGQEPYFIDKSDDKKPVVNSAGDPFDSYQERECGELQITITMNEPTHNAAAADGFSHTTNKDAVTIDGTTYAAGTLKLSPIAAVKQVEVVEVDGASITFVYYRRTYTLKARKDGWKDKPLDVGLNELIPDKDPKKPGKLRPIVDSINAPVKKPWPLNGKGLKKPNITDTPETLEFKPYTEMSWSDLAFTWPATWAV